MDRRRNAAASHPEDVPAPADDDPSPDAATATLVARAADEYLERIAAGESPDVAELASRYPQVAEVLPEVLPVLELLKDLDPLGPAPEDLGEFRIVRMIGRGGMGVVYEAEQVPLDRRVALKVLPAAGAGGARPLARFQVEARVMAALHHPHIVPIFAVGCDRGVHYYAMQLIEGWSLAEQLREQGRVGLAPREVARLAMQAAEALEHAHGLGVLHRDIKPANLLVEPGGHLWVTDFGLARWGGCGVLSGSGDAPGTLRYMSPEQAAGGRVLDPRSDVYSLGATLYELLSGRPAFGGVDRADLLRRIAHVEPVPPRRIDPTIPRDLETIVGKAMAKEPDRRYATARELAEDLGRFLDDRPILARRPGPLERLGRWSRRHARATAGAAALLILAVVASGVGMARLWKEQKRANAALLTAQEARDHEREALMFTFRASDHVAAPALDRIISTVAVRNPAEVMREQEFCRSALGYYLQIAGRYRGDPEMAAIVAAADHRIGTIGIILEEPGAEDACRRSIAEYRALLATAPRDPMLRSDTAMTYIHLIQLLRRTGRIPEALDLYPPLLELLRGLAEALPDEESRVASFTYQQAEYALLLADAGRDGEAARVRRELESNYRLAIERFPRSARLLNNLAWLLAGRPEAAPHDPAGAVALAEQAVALAEQAVAPAPDRGKLWNTLGVAHFRAGEWSEAADALEESMRLRYGGDPCDWLYLAMARHRLGDAAEARRWLDRSLAWIQARPHADPDWIPLRAEALRLLGTEGPAGRGRDVGGGA
jgi:tetratricopeptide (TPR) repeat protein